jgi:hypothetical protein
MNSNTKYYVLKNHYNISDIENSFPYEQSEH